MRFRVPNIVHFFDLATRRNNWCIKLRFLSDNNRLLGYIIFSSYCRSEKIADIYADFCKRLSVYELYINVYYDSQLDCIDQANISWHQDVCMRIQVSNPLHVLCKLYIRIIFMLNLSHCIKEYMKEKNEHN